MDIEQLILAGDLQMLPSKGCRLGAADSITDMSSAPNTSRPCSRASLHRHAKEMAAVQSRLSDVSMWLAELLQKQHGCAEASHSTAGWRVTKLGAAGIPEEGHVCVGHPQSASQQVGAVLRPSGLRGD